MKATPGCDETGALGEALARLMGHLRGKPYGRFQGGPEEALTGEADRFARNLADPLRLTERDQDPRLLDIYARDRALEIHAGNNPDAYAVARSLLAVLLDPLPRGRPPDAASGGGHPVRRN